MCGSSSKITLIPLLHFLQLRRYWFSVSTHNAGVVIENICPVLIDSFSSTNLSHLTFPTFKILSFLNVFNRHEICITLKFSTYMNLSYLHVSSTASITSQAGTSLAIFTFLWNNTIIYEYKSLLNHNKIYTNNTVFRTLKNREGGIFRLTFSFY